MMFEVASDQILDHRISGGDSRVAHRNDRKYPKLHTSKYIAYYWKYCFSSENIEGTTVRPFLTYRSLSLG